MLFKLASTPRLRLTPGFGQRFLDIGMGDEHLDVECICLVLYVLASRLDGHSQDIEKLHAALGAILCRCGSEQEQIPWHLIASRVANKQAARSMEAARELTQPVLRMIAKRKRGIGKAASP